MRASIKDNSKDWFEYNLNGTDFIPDLLDYCQSELRVFLLGGQPGTAELAARKLGERFPRHKVVGTHHGYFKDEGLPEVLDAINGSWPDLLLVGLGNPLQEEFIFHNRNNLNVPVLAGVGAFLDFTAETVARAPRVVRMLHLEWLFRLAQEPLRLGSRYTVDVARFALAIFRLRLSLNFKKNAAIVQAPADIRRLRRNNSNDYERHHNKSNFG